ncbi:hypothetical protein FJZ18_00925 [Candidatus Pacearchaeota archaeon]|nr:hypothetical protein [Candidatus Pacearchaeota archaeon]
MKFYRALGISLLTYFFSMVLGIIVMTVMGISIASGGNDIPKEALIINIILTLILSGISTNIYLNGKGIKPGVREGFLFGIVLVVLGTIIDIIFFSLSSIATGTQQSIIEYYSNPLFWTALILFLATCIITGFLREKR